MRGFTNMRRPISGTCQAFTQNSLDYIVNHPELTKSKTKLSDTPYILIRTRLYKAYLNLKRRDEHDGES